MANLSDYIFTAGNTATYTGNITTANLKADSTGNILVTGNLLPDDGYFLGLPDKPWANAYFGPQSIVILSSQGNIANAVVLENSFSNLSISGGGLQVLANTVPIFEVRAITGQIYSNAQTVIANAVNSSNVTSGSLQTAGGAGIAKDLYVGGNITTQDITINGNIFYNPVYGQFYSNVTQTSTASTPTQITLNNVNGNNNATYHSDGNITIGHGGIYAINALLQIGKAGGVAANAYVWFRKNGVDITNSGFNQIVDKSSQQIATAIFIENVNAGDNVSVMWAQTDSAQLSAVSANADGITQPAIPSVYISVLPVGA